MSGLLWIASGIGVGSVLGWAWFFGGGSPGHYLRQERALAAREREAQASELISFREPLKAPPQENAYWLKRGTYVRAFGLPVDPPFKVEVPAWYVVEYDTITRTASIKGPVA